MDKEILWDNKEPILKKMYLTLGCLLILYLIIALVYASKAHSTNVSLSGEYIPSIVTYTEP